MDEKGYKRKIQGKGCTEKMCKKEYRRKNTKERIPVKKCERRTKEAKMVNRIGNLPHVCM